MINITLIQLVQELWSSDTLDFDFAISIGLAGRPYNSVRISMQHCDQTGIFVFRWHSYSFEASNKLSLDAIG